MGPGASSMVAGLTPSPGGMFNHPRGTSLERLSGWIRNTGVAASAPCRARANRCCVHTTAEGDSDGSHSDAVPLGIARPGGCGAPHHRWSVLCVLRGPLGLPCGHHCGRLPRVHYVDAERPHTEDGSPPLRSCPVHLYVSQTTTVDSLSCSKLGCLFGGRCWLDPASSPTPTWPATCHHPPSTSAGPRPAHPAAGPPAYAGCGPARLRAPGPARALAFRRSPHRLPRRRRIGPGRDHQ
jgi:hypothetical protein